MGLTTLGVAFLRHNRQAGRLRSRFEALVVDRRITAEEFADAAARRARRAGTENLLIEAARPQPRRTGRSNLALFRRALSTLRRQPRQNRWTCCNIKRRVRRAQPVAALGGERACGDPVRRPRNRCCGSGVAQNDAAEKRLTYRVTTSATSG